jgi:hypothetical protein
MMVNDQWRVASIRQALGISSVARMAISGQVAKRVALPFSIGFAIVDAMDIYHDNDTG